MSRYTRISCPVTDSRLAAFGVLFIGRICYELAKTSSFVEDMNLETASETRALFTLLHPKLSFQLSILGFRDQLTTVHERTVSSWRTTAVESAMSLYRLPRELQQNSAAGACCPIQRQGHI